MKTQAALDLLENVTERLTDLACELEKGSDARVRITRISQEIDDFLIENTFDEEDEPAGEVEEYDESEDSEDEEAAYTPHYLELDEDEDENEEVA